MTDKKECDHKFTAELGKSGIYCGECGESTYRIEGVVYYLLILQKKYFELRDKNE